MINTLSTPAIRELKEELSGMNIYKEALNIKKIIMTAITNLFIFLL